MTRRKGRPPKPTALRKLEGNAGKRRLNQNEPKPEPGAPDPPADLRPEVCACYDEIAATCARGVLTASDGLVLELAAQTLHEYRELCSLVGRHGFYYRHKATSGATLVRGFPAVGMRADAGRRLHALFGALGLDPSARTRLHVDPLHGAVNPAEQYLRRRGL